MPKGTPGAWGPFGVPPVRRGDASGLHLKEDQQITAKGQGANTPGTQGLVSLHRYTNVTGGYDADAIRIGDRTGGIQGEAVFDPWNWGGLAVYGSVFAFQGSAEHEHTFDGSATDPDILGHTALNPQAVDLICPYATSGSQTKDSPYLRFVGSYWTGANFSYAEINLRTRVNGTGPDYDLWFHFADGASAAVGDLYLTYHLELYPSVDNVGSLGIAAKAWADAYLYDLHALGNIEGGGMPTSDQHDGKTLWVDTTAGHVVKRST